MRAETQLALETMLKEMRKEDVSKFAVGQCGGCGLEVRFRGIGDARVTCPNFGVEHEIECGEMLDLTSGVKSFVAVLVAVSVGDGGKHFEETN